MASSPSTTALVFLVPFLLYLEFLQLCDGRKDAVDYAFGEGFGIASVEEFKHGSVCLESEVPTKDSLKLTLPYGPCSPSGDPVPSLDQLLSADMGKNAHLQARIFQSAAAENRAKGTSHTSAPHDQALLTHERQQLVSTTLPMADGEDFNTYNFVATVGLGRPTVYQTVHIDTGSTVSWVQCLPCISCYEQREPIFNPRLSRSYRPVQRNSRTCDLLPSEFRDPTSPSNCGFHTAYADNSSTYGYLGIDKLSLGQTRNSSAIQNFTFGCSHRAVGHFGRTAGLFGLERGYPSLINQAGSRVFSYCLPTTSSHTGHLTLGPRNVPSPVVYTRMVPGYPGVVDFYLVNLLGISVGGRRLPLSPSLFLSARTVVDSGTVLSRIPAAAYAALRTAFRNGMRQYRLVAPYQSLDTCYSVSPGRLFLHPDIELHFESGANVLLRAAQVFLNPNATTYCLAFMASSAGHASIIGNTQQRGMEMVFDIQGNRIGFSPGIHC